VSGVLFVADPHAGNLTHDYPLDGGTSTRRREALVVASEIVEHSRRLNAQVVVLGDAYHGKRPPAWAYTALRSLLARSIVLPGNHDWNETGDVSPLHVNPCLSLVTSPCVIPVANFSIIMLPWFGRSQAALGGDSVRSQHASMEQAVGTLVESLLRQCDTAKPVLLCAHMTIAGASYSSDTQPMLGDSSEFVCPLPAVARPGIAAVIAGHVHKPQDIDGGACRVVYPGAATRIDFGDEGNTCRLIHVDETSDGIVATEIPLASPMRFHTLALQGDTESDLPALRDAVVRLKGELPAGSETTALLRSLTDVAMLAGATAVAKPAVRFTRIDQSREHALRVDMPPADMLGAFITMCGGEYESQRDRLLAAHSALTKEVVEHDEA
jgi:DNA repair exonuclease SbcCD nuclease subunit